MKNFILLLCSLFLSTTISAQVLQNGLPLILTDAGNSSQQIFSTDPEFASPRTNFTITSQSDTELYSNTITPTGSDFTLGTTSSLPASSDFSVRYLDAGFGFGYFPTFHKTGSLGTVPNRDVTLEGLFFGGSTEYLETYTTPEDDFGLKTIGARSPIPGVGGLIDGAFTVAAREGTDGLYQLVAIRTGFDGDIRWETLIPMEQTGYDIIFQGQVDGEFVYETQPVPVVSIVKEVPDGYIIVNQNKLYSPPTQNEQYANIIKLDFGGNILWTNNLKIPWREIEIGSNSSANLGLRGRVTSVEGTADGSTYFTFSSSGDINPNAQYRKLDNTGAVVESFSTSWMLNDNFSWLIKEINGEVYWVKLSGIFTDDGPPTNAFDFAIFNITDGITNIESANNPVAFLPPTPGVTYIPKDLEQLANGDFLVTGDYYESISFPDFGISSAASQPFVVRLDNNDFVNNPDLELSSSVNNSNAGAYEYITLTHTITNAGQADASFVQVVINGENAVVAGEIEPVVSQGNLGGNGGDALWVIGDLAAGETATAEITYFTLANNSSYCTEVISISETDPDSSPDNAICGDPQEDDETFIQIGEQARTIRGTVFFDDNRDGGENCTSEGCTFIPGIEINLYIQGTNTLIGTAVSQANGEYVFPDVPTGNYTLEYEYQNNYVPTPYFNGPFGFEFRNNFLDINGETPYIGVIINNSSPETVYNLGLVNGTECTLEELFVETICNDNGTPNNPNDDTFNVNFRADGNGRAAFSLNGSNGSLWNNSITYSEGFRNIGPFDVSELPVTLTLNNLGNLPSISCSLSETINSVDCGSTGGNLPDLTITTTGNIPTSMQPGENYPSAANITNSGLGAANESFDNYIYLSTDANLDASDISLSIVGLANLSVGQSVPFLNIFIPENTSLGEYFILYVVDNDGSIEESNENNNILARPITVGPIGTGGVDLELTASTEVPTIYQNGEAVFTITNTGSQTATNIEVLFAKNSSLNITGVPTTTQGSSAVHWTAAPEWSVGTLAAGQSATITFDIFSLSNAPTLYGQVVFQSETDADSTPDNGNGTTAVEDDEAVYPGDGNIGGEGLQVNCNTTTSPASPIAINPDININAAQVSWTIPTATTDCPGGIVNVEQLNGPTNSGGFFSPITNGYDVVYEFTDECGNSEICIIQFQVLGFAGELICPDPITVTATSAEGAIVTFDDAQPFTGCTASPVGPADGEPQSGDVFPIGTTDVFFSTFFTGSPAFCQTFENCTMTVTVLPEGGGGDGVDLELTASSDAPTIYQNGTATFTITNNGTQTATGVELEFHKNSTVNVTGTPSVTQGTSQVHWTDVPRWNVGTLAAGQSAMITYDIFSLSDNINFYGQVTAQNEADTDSAPNNGNGTTPIEDDEVSYPGGEITVPCQLTITQIEYTCDDQGTSDTSDDTWIQTYVIDNNNPDATGYNISPGGGSGTYPNTLSFGGLVIAADMNTNMFLVRDIDNFECASTISVFPPEGCGEDSMENLPDLTLSELNIIEEAVAGQFMDYTVLVSNEGTVTANGNYIIGAYVSTDDNLSSDDAQLGVISSGNTPVGTEPLTPGAINIPLSQTPGNYFLILETDTNGNITESNENNNIISVPFVILGNTSTCNLTLDVVSVNCQLYTNPSSGVENDTYFYWLTASGDASLEGWYPDAQFNLYEFDQSALFSGSIAEGPQTVTATAYNDPSCVTQVTIVPPAPCGSADDCTMSVFTNNIVCTGNNYSLDMFLNVTAGTYIITLPLADGSGGTYEIADVPAGDSQFISYSTADVLNNLGGEINYTVRKVDNSDCVVQGTLFIPSTCDGDAGEGIDLSLDINAPSTINQYQNFIAEYVVTNSGTTTATNVKVAVFPLLNNTGLVYQGGNEASVSQGDFDGVFGTEWTVGDIPAGGSATLTANLFSLAPSSNTLWGEITTHNETDIDSTPGNGIEGEAGEDDEVSLLLTVVNNFQAGGTTNSTIQVNELSAQLYPVPTRDNLSVDIFTQNASETQLFIRDTHGKILTTRNLAAQKGMQTVQIDTDNWANGVYFLQLFSGEEMKTYRFVKQ